MIYYTTINSPLGKLLLIKNDEVHIGLYFTNYKKCPQIETSWTEDDSRFREIREQLDEYFSGVRKEFNLLISVQGTDFQRHVWDYLPTIPYGKTVTYKEIAIALNKPKAMRAVGSAVGGNPLCVIRPCHRVLPASGGIGGYAGGAEAKKVLLAIENSSLSMNNT